MINKSSPNVDKSNFLHFHYGNKKKISLNIKIEGELIEEKQSTKYLGVMLDNKLNWKAHIQLIKTKLSKATGIIARTRHYATDQVLLNLYYSLFHSHMEYNLLNWSAATKSNLDPIRLSLRAIVRIMSYKSKYEHSTPLFKNLQILPFDLLVKHKTAMFMWKLSNHLIPFPLSSEFDQNEYNDHKFNLPKVDNDFSIRALSFSGVKIWNSEVADILKGTAFLKTFSRKYKDHLLQTLDI